MKTARYAAFAIAFLTPAAWLLMLLGCVKGIAPACEPVNLAAAPLAIGALVLLPLGLVYVERARRRASRGMWQRVPGLGAWRELSHGIKALWEGGSEDGPARLGAARLGQAWQGVERGKAGHGKAGHGKAWNLGLYSHLIIISRKGLNNDQRLHKSNF